MLTLAARDFGTRASTRQFLAAFEAISLAKRTFVEFNCYVWTVSYLAWPQESALARARIIP